MHHIKTAGLHKNIKVNVIAWISDFLFLIYKVKFKLDKIKIMAKKALTWFQFLNKSKSNLSAKYDSGGWTSKQLKKNRLIIFPQLVFSRIPIF